MENEKIISWFSDNSINQPLVSRRRERFDSFYRTNLTHIINSLTYGEGIDRFVSALFKGRKTGEKFRKLDYIDLQVLIRCVKDSVIQLDISHISNLVDELKSIEEYKDYNGLKNILDIIVEKVSEFIEAEKKIIAKEVESVISDLMNGTTNP